MLILLPPSEGKSAPASGPTLDLSALSYPELTDARSSVLEALTRLCSGSVTKAATTLGLGPTQHGEVGANTRLDQEPCAPAIEVYTGVLYEALDAESLTRAARTRLDEQVAIASGLWGLLRPSDPIPSYRLSGSVTLPRLGKLSSVWRGHITGLLSASDDLVVDMRSGSYVALGPLPESAAGRAVTIRVLTERKGKRTVVSHHNKATKGWAVRSLAQSRRRPTTIDELMDVLSEAGHEVELSSPARGAVQVLDLILRE